ncbi:HAD family hydrolase [Arcobacter sp.]|uniref:HAD family hydrolase n=1 Tax=Arcobacter sp. TaxID=1872629 RepID=UPI003D0C7EA8
MHHVMFDIDGTLVQSNDFDTKCFIEAVKEVIGISVDGNWSEYKYVTASGILNEIIASYGLQEQKQKIQTSVKKKYINKIETYLQQNSVSQISGASVFLSHLRKNKNIVLSIATGGWFESAVLKLRYANIDFEGIPIVSSNDNFSRTEIMKLASTKIENNNYKVSYFGDGSWDKKACEDLGYNFIAVGNEVEHYQSIDDFSSIDEAMQYIDL